MRSEGGHPLIHLPKQLSNAHAMHSASRSAPLQATSHQLHRRVSTLLPLCPFTPLSLAIDHIFAFSPLRNMKTFNALLHLLLQSHLNSAVSAASQLICATMCCAPTNSRCSHLQPESACGILQI